MTTVVTSPPAPAAPAHSAHDLVRSTAVPAIWRALRIVGVGAGVVVLLVLAADVAASFTRAGNGAYFIEDKDLFIVRKPDQHGYTLGNGCWNECHINKAGLRGEDLPEPLPADEHRILCVGDSFTFGGGVEDGEAWPAQLQGMLGAPESSGVRVLNGGANGWDTRWQRRYLEARALDQFHPDVVVLGWNWNDLNVDPTQQTGPEYARHFLEGGGTWLSVFAHFQILRESHLYRWAATHVLGTDVHPSELTIQRNFRSYARSMASVAVAPELKIEEARKRRFPDGQPDLAFWEATDTPVWKMVRSELTAMKASCAAKGSKLVVALLPEPTWDGPGTFPGVPRMTALLDSLGVPWVDCQPEFMARGPQAALAHRRPELWLHFDPVHPVPAGQKLMAEDVARVLRKQSLVADAGH